MNSKKNKTQMAKKEKCIRQINIYIYIKIRTQKTKQKVD